MLQNLPIAIALVTLAIAPTAKPAWEVADKWTCRAERLRICRGAADVCESAPGRAVLNIDFGAGTMRVFDTDPRFSEIIVYKKFTPFDENDTHVVMFSGGARMLMFGRRLSGDALGDPAALPATFISADAQSVVTHAMTCQPQS